MKSKRTTLSCLLWLSQSSISLTPHDKNAQSRDYYGATQQPHRSRFPAAAGPEPDGHISGDARARVTPDDGAGVEHDGGVAGVPVAVAVPVGKTAFPAHGRAPHDADGTLSPHDREQDALRVARHAQTGVETGCDGHGDIPTGGGSG